jgi:vacuolar-type H+-ATPase subunit H
LSGIDAVRKIVETEGQARRIVDEATAKTQQLISEAREQAEGVRQESVARARQQREGILSDARERAEAEARQSDQETQLVLANYQKLSEARKQDAVSKALELILNA